MAIVTEDRLYQGNPRGVGVYNSDRSSYDSGGGGITEIPDKYVTKSELSNAIQGVTGTFIGNDLTNYQITLTHDLKRKPVGFDLYQNGKLIDPSNYKLDSGNSTTYAVLTLSYPFNESDEFEYKFL
ncbi:MAG: hypothetical protein K9J21_07375 [Bacteroidales bacterium]|nr:hypothetical protein [Bacteroidales bacterium]